MEHECRFWTREQTFGTTEEPWAIAAIEERCEECGVTRRCERSERTGELIEVGRW